MAPNEHLPALWVWLGRLATYRPSIGHVHLGALPYPLPPFCFSARPPSHQGGVLCEAPRRYRTPHGVLCVRMFVTFGGGKEVIAALATELQRRVSPCNGLQ